MFLKRMYDTFIEQYYMLHLSLGNIHLTKSSELVDLASQKCAKKITGHKYSVNLISTYECMQLYFLHT